MKNRAQAILDYVVSLTIVIAILLLMGYYIRNSLVSKYREGADNFGRGDIYVPLGGTNIIEDQIINE
ncbi:MAG: hypothetical protein ISS45_02320 [Candidatus Omnitrophica bacterium]|nr:hypothetical protein [Candidatus Omnitrophota bacterium]